MEMAHDAFAQQRAVERAQNRREAEIFRAVIVAIADFSAVSVELHHGVVDVELLAAPLGLVDEVLDQIREARRARQQQMLE